MSVMGLLGMTSCHCPKQVTETTPPQPDPKDTVVAPDPRNFAVMYGVPQMDFQVKGRVVNGEGKPVEGMQVILLNQSPLMNCKPFICMFRVQGRGRILSTMVFSGFRNWKSSSIQDV